MRIDHRIAVIGHIVWDKIIRPDGRSVESFGGIAYNLAALSSVADDSTVIYPVCNIGKDLFEEFHRNFESLPHLDLSCCHAINQPNELHILKYAHGGYRNEDNKYPLPRLSRRLFDNCPGLDIALVNYIGGDEFPPIMLRWLKTRFHPLVYLDFHSLALGRTADNRRYFRCHPQWRNYVSAADIIQMNYYELKTIFKDIEDEIDDIGKAAAWLVSLGPQCAIITRENREVIVAQRRGPHIGYYTLRVPKIETVVDPTGCGDSFAAGFVHSYCRAKNIGDACETGLRLAAKKATFSGMRGFFRKK